MRHPSIRPFLGGIAAVALLAGCTSSAATTSPAATDSSSASAESTLVTEETITTAAACTVSSEVLSGNAATHLDESDLAWDTSSEVAITLDGDSASASGGGVSIDGSTVTITSAGAYRISGELADGQLVVDTSDTGLVHLILDGVDITSSTTAAIAVMSAEEAVVVLADGTQNALTDAAEYVYPDASTDEPNAALFSDVDLTITGEGALTVTGNANDGIASKDGLVVTAGSITIDAIDDGLRGKHYLVVTGGVLDITAGGDALKSDEDSDATEGYIWIGGGELTVDAGGDGIAAVTDAVITAGTIDIAAGGGASATLPEDLSAKGVKAATCVVIEGGSLAVDAADDAVHSDTAVSIAGGELTLASGDDAVHADGTLDVSGGTLTVTSSVEGLEAAVITISDGELDITSSDDAINASDGSGSADAMGPGVGTSCELCSVTISGGVTVLTADGDGLDSNGSMSITGGAVVVHGPTNDGNGAIDVDGEFTVDGGVLLAVGSSGMAYGPDEASAQGWMFATLSSPVSAGQTVQIATAGGEVIASFVAERSLGNVVFSSAAIESGQSYHVLVGGSVAGAAVGGLYDGGDASGATSVATVTAGEGGYAGMGGGAPGGGVAPGGGGAPGGGSRP